VGACSEWLLHVGGRESGFVFGLRVQGVCGGAEMCPWPLS
jgi:hypothetical protein